MKRLLIHFIHIGTVIFASGSVFAQVNDKAVDRGLYDLGVSSFLKNDWAASEKSFKGLNDANFIAPELYYNIGAAVEKLERPGEAVLWMRRAILIDPGMIEPMQNLKFLKNKLGYLEFSDEGLPAVLRSLPPSLGAWIAMTGLWLVAICLAMAFLLPRYQERRFRPLFFACLAAALALAGAWFSQHYTKNFAIENFATITANGVTARTSPVPDAKTVIDLPPGSEVRILQNAGPWTYVEIPGEIRGWLRNEQLAPIWPANTPTS